MSIREIVLIVCAIVSLLAIPASIYVNLIYRKKVDE